ncbi:glycosyltransferase [Niallia sp. 03091]|uniref:glycosyltransferase n=2 Tax=unclassified Niallia TaxID=2837522 RepID=UPI004043B299
MFDFLHNSYPLLIISIILILFIGCKMAPVLKNPLIIICLLTNGIYITWRICFTIPVSDPLSIVMGLLLIITEIIGFLQLIIFYILLWKPAKQKTASLHNLKRLPSVDIYIATYNEPLSILKRTIAGCINLDYPKELVNIYICDDGKRKSIQSLAQDFAVHYITREDNKHAKAGNLNNAMAHSNGELIVTMDADMVPFPSFLQKTVGYFKKKSVAFVQTPQAFYNDDPYQFNMFSNKNIPNEQDFFMRTLQAGKDRFNSVMYVGSNAIFRRKALEDIGGFATGVITEDMATGMLIQRKFRSVFVSDVCAVGLAPESWLDLLKQRDRWCRGNIQCARKWNPLTLSGLSLMQRILYFDGILYWFFGVYKMIYMLAPLLFLLFGIHSLDASLYSLFVFWMPSFLSSYLAFKHISNQKRTMTWSHIYDITMAPHMAFSSLSELLFKKRLEFKVTPKGKQSASRHFAYLSILPHAIFIVLTCIALIKVLLDYFVYDSFDINLTSINLFWVLFNLIGLIMAIFMAFERPRFRNAERFEMQEKFKISLLNQSQKKEGLLKDLSDTGARVELSLNSYKQLDENIHTLEIDIIGPLNCQVTWISQEHNRVEIGLKFNDIPVDQYSRLIKFLYNESIIKHTVKERGSNIFFTIIRFLRRTKKQPHSYKRQYLREEVNSTGQLIPSRLNTEFPVSSEKYLDTQDISLLDISSNGCKIEVKQPIVLDQIVNLSFPDIDFIERTASVKWIRKMKRNRYAVGLKFIDDSKVMLHDD